MKIPTSTTSSTATATVLGLGSLLSERSSRSTFPDLTNFRLGRVSSRYRRVFGHPASIFFQRGLADEETKEFSSLSAEIIDAEDKAEDNGDSGYGGGFVCSVFEVPRDQVYRDERRSDDDGTAAVVAKPTGAFLEREEEFDIVEVPFAELSDDDEAGDEGAETTETGILCTRFTDVGYVDRWGPDRFRENYGRYGIDTIWGWEKDSGLRPCRVYLRHCLLAAESMGGVCLDSFLDETFLVDRTTTVREYLARYPGLVENAVPPPGFEERYGG